MTFPRSNPSIEGNDAAQFASESRGGRLNSDSGQGFFETSHSTTTLQTPRVAANVDSRIPVAEHDQQEDFEQYFKDTPLWTSASPQDRLSYNDSPDARRASDSSERTLYEETAEEMHRSLQKVSLSSYQHPNEIPSPPNAYFSGPPRSYVKRRSGHKSSLDESDAPLDDVDREASPHRVWYRIFSSSLASRTRTANGVIMDRIFFARALLASLNRIYARVFRACTHSAVMMRMTRGSPVQRASY